MNAELDGILRSLAELVGSAAEDLDSDHGRWRLYEKAINAGVGSALLLRAVALDADRSLAVSVVLRVLELVPDDEHATWISQLEPDNRAYSQKRSAEICLFRRARSEGLDMVVISESLDSWSDWLQLRLAASLEDRRALSVIASRGRTKRIRNAAAERMKDL